MIASFNPDLVNYLYEILTFEFCEEISVFSASSQRCIQNILTIEFPDPDLFLVDIHFGGGKKGPFLAKKIKEKFVKSLVIGLIYSQEHRDSFLQNDITKIWSQDTDVGELIKLFPFVH